jgi:hypothetical protein
MQINITFLSSTIMNAKYMIAMLTAGILSALMVASLSGNVLAASSSSSAESIGGVTTLSADAEAEPGQTGCSTFAALIPHGQRPITVIDLSCAASDTGVVGTAAGLGVNCGTGVSTPVGSCAQANPANPNSNSNPGPQSLIALPLP